MYYIGKLNSFFQVIHVKIFSICRFTIITMMKIQHIQLIVSVIYQEFH